MTVHRLPTPGSDDGTWGDILNDFLSVSHASDGTLNPGVVSDATISGGAAISKSKLSTDVQTSLSSADSAVQSVNSKSPASGDVSLTASDVGAIAGIKATTAPSSPATNDLWYDSTNDLWKRWSGSAWVVAGSNTYQPLALFGTLAARPTATSVPVDSLYDTSGDSNDGGGAIYRATSSGWVTLTPQVNATSGTELGYAELTSSITNTTSGAMVDATGLSVTFTQGTRPVYFHFFGNVKNSVAGDLCVFQFLIDGTTALGSAISTSTAAGQANPIELWVRSNPLLSAGSHTVKVQWIVSASSTGTINATSTNRPFLRVVSA